MAKITSIFSIVFASLMFLQTSQSVASTNYYVPQVLAVESAPQTGFEDQSGCPLGSASWDLGERGDSLRIHYRGFDVFSAQTIASVQQKQCHLTAQFHVAAGVQYAIEGVTIRSHLFSSGPQAQGRYAAAYHWQGTSFPVQIMDQGFGGPFNGDFAIVRAAPMLQYSPCSSIDSVATVDLRTLQSAYADAWNSASITGHYFNRDVTYEYRIVGRLCQGSWPQPPAPLPPTPVPPTPVPTPTPTPTPNPPTQPALFTATCEVYLVTSQGTVLREFTGHGSHAIRTEAMSAGMADGIAQCDTARQGEGQLFCSALAQNCTAVQDGI